MKRAILLCALGVSPAVQGDDKTIEVEINGLPKPVEPQLLPGVRNVVPADPVSRVEASRQARLVRGQVLQALQAFGYYRATADTSLRDGDPSWSLVVQVDPGTRVPLRDVDVAVEGPAAKNPEVAAALKDFPIRTGDPLDHQAYEQAKQNLLERITENGYLQARLTKRRIEVDTRSYEARVQLHIDSGPLIRFGEVVLVQDSLDLDYLQKFINIAPGTRYSTTSLLELEAALRDSEYFESVNIEPQLENLESGRIPVKVQLSPTKPSKYTLGLGFGTDTGIRATLGWERRRVNRRGHRFRSLAQVSGVSGSVDLQYTIPFRDPRSDQYSLYALYRTEDPDTSDSELGRIGITRSVLLGRSRWDVSLNYQRESFTVADQSDVVDLLIPGVGFSRVTADDVLVTRSGALTEVNLRGGHEAFGDVEFLQLQVRTKFIRTLASRHRFIARGRLAYTLASEVQVLPASLRFFAGGDQSVRGFSYKSLGPENDSGEVIGGRHLMIGSLEYDYRLSEKWRLAGFFDAGNAFDEFDEPLEKSVGLGVRWITPIGPLRVDLAQPLDTDAGSLRLHVYLGPDL